MPQLSGVERAWQTSRMDVGGLQVAGAAVFPGTTGKVFFVDSNTGSNGYTGLSIQDPVATIDFAIGLCTANKGDTIYVMPGHAETIGNGTIACDVAGVTFIGLGDGAAKPT